MFKHPFVIAFAVVAAFGAPQAFSAQNTGAATGQGFSCDKDVCVCVGKADCKKLIGTGWCNDRLQCTSQRCQCTWFTAPVGNRKPIAGKPTTRK